MPSFFSRIFKIGQAKIHGVIDELEDPIKLTEQGIRDLKISLQDTMKSLAEVKGLAIRIGKDASGQKSSAEDYERKAMLLLQKAQAGGVSEEEAERLAREALTRKEQAATRAAELTQQATAQQDMSDKLQAKVNDLKSKITTYENELVTLKARHKTANATRKINQQMSSLDSDGTVSMLERMREKVTEQESLAEAYGDMADSSASVDDEITKALSSGTSAGVEDSLAKMKAQLNAPKSE